MTTRAHEHLVVNHHKVASRRPGLAAVTCLGTTLRGDDAVGPLVAESLRERGIEPLDCGDEPARLLDQLGGLDTLVVVDAVRTGAPPGTILRREAVDDALPRDLGLASTHALGIADVIALARALGKAPRRVVVVGIEGVAFGMGDPLSPAVEDALDTAVAEVVRTIGEG